MLFARITVFPFTQWFLKFRPLTLPLTALCGSQKMSKLKQLPPRSKVKPADCWNLDSLFKSDAAWETAFKKWESEIPGYEKFAGHLGDSAKSLANCLEFDIALDRAGERLGTYAFLKTAEDHGQQHLSADDRPLSKRRQPGRRGCQLSSARKSWRFQRRR